MRNWISILVLTVLVFGGVALAQTAMPGSPLGSTAPSGSHADPATVTGTLTSPRIPVASGAHTLTDSAMVSHVGGTTCTSGQQALAFGSDPDTGMTLVTSTNDVVAFCNNGQENFRTTASPSLDIGGPAGGTDCRMTVNLTNGQPKIAGIQLDNADGSYQMCNGSTQCAVMGEGHSSGSGVGTGSFNAFFGNDATGGAADEATIIYTAGNKSNANGGGAIRINSTAVGRRLTIDATGPSGVTTLFDGGGSKKVVLGTTTPISFPGVTSVAALEAETGDQEIDLDAPFVNLVNSGVAGCTSAQGAAYSVAPPGTGGFTGCSNGTAGQPVFAVTNAGTSNSSWTADGRMTATGSVTAPAFAIFNDTDTGMYESAANTVAFACGGVACAAFANGSTLLTGHLRTVDYVEIDTYLDATHSAVASDAGTGTCTSVTVTGTAIAGHITATCTAGQTVVVTMGVTMAAAPDVMFTPQDGNSATGIAEMSASTTTSFTLKSTAGTIGAARWGYFVP